jgi:hypothetical protein
MVERVYITKELENIKDLNPGLVILDIGAGRWLLRGNLRSCREYNTKIIDDEYMVEINIPSNFPTKIPQAKEVGGRIPRSFHTNIDDTLCLGTPLNNSRSFNIERTIGGFINSCLIPYLFSFSYKERFGELPYGEMPHGFRGIIECYKEEFQTDNIKYIVALLEFLATDNFPAFEKCPCQSGKSLLKCHGKKILELKNVQLPEDFESELKMILTLS